MHLQKRGEKMTRKKQLKDKGFTLVEMMIILSIFAILLGILIPSLNTLVDYRATRAAKSISSGLERMRIEAMSRLVAEMKLEKKSDGYYISYCLHKGKQAGMVWTDEEKIAPARTSIKYRLAMKDSAEIKTGESIILTVDRSTKGFRPLQSAAVTTDEVNALIDNNEDIAYHDIDGAECCDIIVSGTVKKRIISLNQTTGKCTVTSG